MTTSDLELLALVEAVVANDASAAAKLLADSPALATAAFKAGATRQAAEANYIEAIEHYRLQGDTALHLAAAGYRLATVRLLIAAGADASARNRRGGEPLHYAAAGNPGLHTWNPSAQASVITCLVEAGADPNAVNMDGVGPLHIAVRNRCTAAVIALLDAGADPLRVNGKGSTPMQLATWTTGRGGSGSPEAKAQQDEILRVLTERGAT